VNQWLLGILGAIVLGLGTWGLTTIGENTADLCEQRIAAVESRLAVCEAAADRASAVCADQKAAMEAQLSKAAVFIANGCE
jgi:hypothetical protein